MIAGSERAGSQHDAHTSVAWCSWGVGAQGSVCWGAPTPGDGGGLKKYSGENSNAEKKPQGCFRRLGLER